MSHRYIQTCCIFNEGAFANTSDTHNQDDLWLHSHRRRHCRNVHAVQTNMYDEVWCLSS